MSQRQTPVPSRPDLHRIVPEFTGWALIAIGAILALVATGTGTDAGGAAALLGTGVALIVIARAGSVLGHVRGTLTSRAKAAPDAADAAPGAPSASAVPHHRATRALLGETVKALNSTDPSAPWTIERDGGWASADVFDYAVYRRRDRARPARVAVEVHPAAGLDIAQTALGIATSYAAGGGLYDGVLVIAESIDDVSAERLGALASRLTGVPCAVLSMDVRAPGDADARDDAMIRVAEALDRLSESRADATPPATPSAPAAAPRPASPESSPASPARRDTVPAWSAVAPADETRTLPLGTTGTATDDFAALLAQAETDSPPSRRSRSQR